MTIDEAQARVDELEEQVQMAIKNWEEARELSKRVLQAERDALYLYEKLSNQKKQMMQTLVKLMYPNG